MIREKFEWKPHKNESTDVEHSGGSPRSSDEVSVVEMEQRGRVTQPDLEVNQNMGGIFGEGKAV